MTLDQKGNPALYTGPAQPFFEQALGGPTSAFCSGFSSCTAALASPQTPGGVKNPNSQLSNLQLGAAYSLWSTLSRSEEHMSELQSPDHLVCRLLLEKKKKKAQRRSKHRYTLIHSYVVT